VRAKKIFAYAAGTELLGFSCMLLIKTKPRQAAWQAIAKLEKRKTISQALRVAIFLHTTHLSYLTEGH
jgi:hypothetical protein